MLRTSAYSEQQSETWLLERTYHARLRNGKELSVPDFTWAMKQIVNFYVPLSTWQEIAQAEAHAANQQGTPVLLYGESLWVHSKGALVPWGANRNMRTIIFGNAVLQPEAVSGTNYAVRYLDPRRGNFSNASWQAWFASDSATLFDGSDLSTVSFLAPCFQFPYTTHYTVMAADGQLHEYVDRAEARQGFEAFLPQARDHGSSVQTVAFPHLCYYHEITCPDGVYRLEFFGPHMDEQGYQINKVERNGENYI
ncbi:hypothetical protein EPA93_40950 [Ktedonosporobacter rubrisoli]|uniref:Uncharacterized protein n=1 Tax=Ktedonosporobacter rubrisoli TaxID=2509675 RepID=A0A4P6K2S1_KTERU|nr:hypothetical protein [Ktedonosporobacter rubrisoli]QBD82010.1 hypothetical protein EPA93_40950 [Ktedonosporobacter rubrisoli]